MCNTSSSSRCTGIHGQVDSLGNFLKQPPYMWLPHHDLFMKVSAQVSSLPVNFRAVAWGVFTIWRNPGDRSHSGGRWCPATQVFTRSPGSSQLAVPCHWFSYYAALCALRHFHNNIERAWSPATNRSDSKDSCRKFDTSITSKAVTLVCETGSRAGPRARTSLRMNVRCKGAYLGTCTLQNAGF